MRRRSALRLGGLVLAGGLAGCTGTAPPDVDPNTGLAAADTAAAALEGTPVYRAGDVDALPEPPTTTDSLADAEAALATRDADRAPLAVALREGTTVAYAGAGAGDALEALLADVEGYGYGVETITGKAVAPAVATPRGESMDTFQFIAEGGWADSLEPLAWALHPRLPDCRTFVPESSADELYAVVGRAWIAGRLPSGETYASRTVGSRHTGDGASWLRLRTTLHAAANGGYAVDGARRVADFPNDEALSDWFPNPHERNGVEVSNTSDPIAERLAVSFEPTTDRTRGALTGCCGATVDGVIEYDHRTSWQWTNRGLFDADGRYGGGTGRGKWHVPQ